MTTPISEPQSSDRTRHAARAATRVASVLARAALFLALVGLAPAAALAQDAAGPAGEAPSIGAAAVEEYRIGPHDVLTISVLQAPELNGTARVSERGEISMPLLGFVPVGGLSIHEIKAAIEGRLRQNYIRQPDVRVELSESHSLTVSVLGAVQKPAMLQVRGTMTLLEVISLAGGLAEDAGESVMVVRNRPNAETAVLEVGLKALMESRDIGLNLPVHPGDIVNVQHAATVYVVGEINNPGEFVMRSNDRLTVLRALALGGGLTAVASRGGAVVLRTGENGERTEIPVDLGRILNGRDPDVVLSAQDVLFVPGSAGRAASRTAIDALVRLVRLRPL